MIFFIWKLFSGEIQVINMKNIWKPRSLWKMILKKGFLSWFSFRKKLLLEKIGQSDSVQKMFKHGVSSK